MPGPSYDMLCNSCAQSEKTLVLRVKRKKLTVFVTAEPTDTVLEVKEILHDLLSQVGSISVLASLLPKGGKLELFKA